MVNKINIKKIEKDKIRLNKFWATHIIETLYIFIVEILFKVMVNNFKFDASILRILLSSIIISFILTVITNNLSDKIRKPIISIVNLFIAFYAWLQIGFVNFLGAYMSIGNAEQGTKITNYIFDFLSSYKWYIHLIFIPFIFITLYYVKENKLIKYTTKINFKDMKNNFKMVGYVGVFAVLFTVTLNLKFMQDKLQIISNKDLVKYPSNPALAIKNFGTSGYFLLDVKGTMFGAPDEVFAQTEKEEKKESTTRKFDDTAWNELINTEKNEIKNSLNKYFINRPIVEKNKYTGKFKDKNVIFVMLESVSQVPFSARYKEYFPTLYKLYTEGITGVNNYSPRNNCATGESEMTSQISLYSIETTCTVNTYQKNKYPEALLSMLAKNGYYTSTYHNFTDHYYDRQVFEYNFGTKAYYGVDDLKIPHSPLYKEWPSDIALMEEGIPKFIDHDKFASYMITVTAHQPYRYSSEYGDKYLNLFENMDIDIEAKRYLSKVKETDLALKYLLDALKENKKLDDTVLVIFGDHYPYGLNNEIYQSIADYDISSNHEVDRTPFIIYNSKTKPEKITKVTTPLDYTPTILNLLGIEYDPRYYLGNDVFSDYKDMAIFPDNSWQIKEGYYDISRSKFIPNNESDTISDEEIIKLSIKANELRKMGNLAIKNNYFKYLFDYFDKYDEQDHELEENKNEPRKNNN